MPASNAGRVILWAEPNRRLFSDAVIWVMRSVERFDFARNVKFSTYASWAIMKNFARTIPDEFKHRDRFRTSHEGRTYYFCSAGCLASFSAAPESYAAATT